MEHEFIQREINRLKKAKRDTQASFQGYKEKGEKVSFGGDFILSGPRPNFVCDYPRFILFQRLRQLIFLSNLNVSS